MSVVRPKSLVRFGVFGFDPETGDLWKAGHRQRLQDQQREVLRLLIECPGELVPRDTIQRRLWPDGTFVDAETGLNVIVNRIRQTLGDAAASPRFIETLPRKGYRFIAPVQLLRGADLTDDSDGAPRDARQPRPPDDEGRRDAPQPPTLLESRARYRVWLGAGGLVLAVATMAILVRMATGHVASAGPAGAAFAVMPLVNLLGGSGSDYMVDGLTDSVITDLAAATGVHVIARQSVMRYRGREHDIPGIARELGVHGLVEGSVVRHETGYAVNVQLVEGDTGRTIWAGRFDRATWNALATSDDIALALARAMGGPMSAEASARLRLKHQVVPEARIAYLRGRFFLNKRNLNEAESYFEAAIRIQPDYAAAWAGLAMLFATGEPGSLSTEDIESGERAAHEALRLDPTLGEARTALGKLHVRQWRWSEAEREARRALDTSPDDATAHQWLGTLLLRIGRCDEALTQVQDGVRIDPLAPIVNEALGSVYLGCGRPAQAIEPVRLVVTMYPDIARSHRQLGTVLASTGDFGAGIPELREALRLAPDDCLNGATLAHALGASGARQEALAIVGILERRKSVSPASPYCLAIAYASVGDIDRAFENLERAYAQHVSLLDLLLIEWRLGSCRTDPRYAELLRKVGLLPYAASPEVVVRGPSFNEPLEATSRAPRD
jgi:TolB-like protein/DNA-binding winged helix-turn-helix (wHTH) protein/Flp pilus assembly protein TadD